MSKDWGEDWGRIFNLDICNQLTTHALTWIPAFVT